MTDSETPRIQVTIWWMVGSLPSDVYLHVPQCLEKPRHGLTWDVTGKHWKMCLLNHILEGGFSKQEPHVETGQVCYCPALACDCDLHVWCKQIDRGVRFYMSYWSWDKRKSVGKRFYRKQNSTEVLCLCLYDGDFPDNITLPYFQYDFCFIFTLYMAHINHRTLFGHLHDS